MRAAAVETEGRRNETTTIIKGTTVIERGGGSKGINRGDGGISKRKAGKRVRKSEAFRYLLPPSLVESVENFKSSFRQTATYSKVFGTSCTVSTGNIENIGPNYFNSNSFPRVSRKVNAAIHELLLAVNRCPSSSFSTRRLIPFQKDILSLPSFFSYFRKSFFRSNAPPLSDISSREHFSRQGENEESKRERGFCVPDSICRIRSSPEFIPALKILRRPLDMNRATVDRFLFCHLFSLPHSAPSYSGISISTGLIKPFDPTVLPFVRTTFRVQGRLREKARAPLFARCKMEYSGDYTAR